LQALDVYDEDMQLQLNVIKHGSICYEASQTKTNTNADDDEGEE